MPRNETEAATKIDDYLVAVTPDPVGNLGTEATA